MEYLFFILGFAILIIIIFIMLNIKNKKTILIKTNINNIQIENKAKSKIEKENARVFLSNRKYNSISVYMPLNKNIKKGIELKQEEKNIFFEIYENALLNEIAGIYKNKEEAVFYIYELIHKENKKENYNITKCLFFKNNTFVIQNKIYKIKESDILKLKSIINI